MKNTVPPDRGSLDDDHHVLRYVRPRFIDNGIVDGDAFLGRAFEAAPSGPSVHWLEWFDPPLEDQVDGVRSVSRMKPEKKGCFARIAVGPTRSYIRLHHQDSLELNFVHKPSPAIDEFPEDPSHTIIVGVPVRDTPEAAAVRALLTDCVVPPLFSGKR